MKKHLVKRKKLTGCVIFQQRVLRSTVLSYNLFTSKYLRLASLDLKPRSKLIFVLKKL